MLEGLAAVIVLVAALAYFGASAAVAVGTYLLARRSHRYSRLGAGIAALAAFVAAPVLLAYFVAYRAMEW